jgi:hypothetical protein
MGRAFMGSGGLVPVVGWALTTIDIAIPMGQGVSVYTTTYKNAGVIYHIDH